MNIQNYSSPPDKMLSLVDADFAEIERRVLAYLVANPGVAEHWRQHAQEQIILQARRDGFLAERGL